MKSATSCIALVALSAVVALAGWHFTQAGNSPSPPASLSADSAESESYDLIAAIEATRDAKNQEAVDRAREFFVRRESSRAIKAAQRNHR